ncbi:uncharacterized PE-PGRS family protein PE_PGRS10-like [Nerophis ophidion]|uniref:uncharacterized PE-PGRS family protein PE_PGRS10-like n=1 Tax=Nerophis ophidion TaxID=159077 RepID=UPI002ADF6325|nr:uncharacterized PE-PGRS family protein PE_PGRS10-like [Nerophis ophidion]XP_061731328.1 uncharacterized PE-PGRS family protein PE_PGRS10-like [Nerophis ophidion]XP_061731329.1 uncharacterized PE-PGRS family protein PE_PGRS10-like [Nerophis ophidion]XP_061731330.1 uncharacterized PE-PGRS family protein PE_PGRS10-like [Nerophis ophidion]XP_061731331.1 uncharacterized PE-PGRS family protein PE_PGRS10-like [Nerophis ophidion]
MAKVGPWVAVHLKVLETDGWKTTDVGVTNHQDLLIDRQAEVTVLGPFRIPAKNWDQLGPASGTGVRGGGVSTRGTSGRGAYGREEVGEGGPGWPEPSWDQLGGVSGGSWDHPGGISGDDAGCSGSGGASETAGGTLTSVSTCECGLGGGTRGGLLHGSWSRVPLWCRSQRGRRQNREGDRGDLSPRTRDPFHHRGPISDHRVGHGGHRGARRSVQGRNLQGRRGVHHLHHSPGAGQIRVDQ